MLTLVFSSALFTMWASFIQGDSHHSSNLWLISSEDLVQVTTGQDRSGRICYYIELVFLQNTTEVKIKIF